MAPPGLPSRGSSKRKRSASPKTCKMSDVILLPFPLTWLWGSGKYAPSSAHLSVDDKAAPASDKIQSDSNTRKLASGTTRLTSSTTQLGSETTPSTSDTPIPVSSATRSTSKGSANTCSTPTEKVEFKAGEVSIPDEINTLCKQIRGCKHHQRTNLPIRMELRRLMPEHFNMGNATLKSGSPLHKWYGDTRLFSQEEWLYLKGKSRDETTQCNG